MKVFASGGGWRPLLPVIGAERSRSRCAKRAPGMWPLPNSSRPQSGFIRSWRQSNTRHCAPFARLPASSSVVTSVVWLMLFRRKADLPAQPFVEMHHRVLHRRLVGAGVVQALLPQRLAAAIDALADLVVLERSLVIRGLLRFAEFALARHDFLRGVELHH